MIKKWACNHKQPFKKYGIKWKCPSCGLIITLEVTE